MGCDFLFSFIALVVALYRNLTWQSSIGIALLMLVIALSGIFSRQSLIPKINNYRDAEIAGDTKAKSKFDRLLRMSVGINGGQIIVLIISIVNIYQAGLRHTY